MIAFSIVVGLLVILVRVIAICMFLCWLLLLLLFFFFFLMFSTLLFPHHCERLYVFTPCPSPLLLLSSSPLLSPSASPLCNLHLPHPSATFLCNLPLPIVPSHSRVGAAWAFYSYSLCTLILSILHIHIAIPGTHSYCPEPLPPHCSLDPLIL